MTENSTTTTEPTSSDLWRKALLASLGIALEFLGAIALLDTLFWAFMALLGGGSGLLLLIQVAVGLGLLLGGGRIVRANIRRFNGTVVLAIVIHCIGLLALLPMLLSVSSLSTGGEFESASQSSWLWFGTCFAVGVFVIRQGWNQVDAPDPVPAPNPAPAPAIAPAVVPQAELSEKNQRLRTLGLLSTVFGWTALGLSLPVLLIGSMYGAVAGGLMMFGDTSGTLQSETSTVFGSGFGLVLLGVGLLIAGSVLKSKSNKQE